MSTTRTFVKRQSIKMKVFRVVKALFKPIYILKAIRILLTILIPKKKK
jgi:hypothetical protein|nr:MAG TPA: hypothetical protein [Caudoviricetes sp.]